MGEDIDVSELVEELVEAILHIGRALVEHVVSELKQQRQDVHQSYRVLVGEEVRDHFNHSGFQYFRHLVALFVNKVDF